jgi:hypothetical protein
MMMNDGSRTLGLSSITAPFKHAREGTRVRREFDRSYNIFGSSAAAQKKSCYFATQFSPRPCAIYSVSALDVGETCQAIRGFRRVAKIAIFRRTSRICGNMS